MDLEHIFILRLSVGAWLFTEWVFQQRCVYWLQNDFVACQDHMHTTHSLQSDFAEMQVKSGQWWWNLWDGLWQALYFRQRIFYKHRWRCNFRVIDLQGLAVCLVMSLLAWLAACLLVAAKRLWRSAAISAGSSPAPPRAFSAAFLM